MIFSAVSPAAGSMLAARHRVSASYQFRRRGILSDPTDPARRSVPGARSASLAGVVATPVLKRRQQVPKPRDRAPKFINR